MYAARVLADSVPYGQISEELAEVNALFKHPDRLITVEVTFPRFILAEVNTHRVFSRNSASSRAIPVKKKIKAVKENPFVPEKFNAYTKGMGVGEELSPEDQRRCKQIWLDARDAAVESAEAFLEVAEEGIDKSRANRLLEPFDWQTAIITSSRWENFFALRNHPGAQPEFQILVAHMLRAMQASFPKYLGPGEWHLPLIDGDELETLPDAIPAFQVYDPDAFVPDLVIPRISAGRCARSSYDKQHDPETAGASYKREVEKLENNGHLSPAEHPATPRDMENSDTHGEIAPGNLGEAWIQLRKLIPNEDNLVGVLEGKPPWYEAIPEIPLEAVA